MLDAPHRATVIRADIPWMFHQGGIDRRNHTSQSRRENSIDGTLLSVQAVSIPPRLTGESVPETLRAGETVSRMVNLSHVVDVRVERVNDDSALFSSEMVQEATSRKAKTELFIRRFAVFTRRSCLYFLINRIDSPLVISDYVFTDWL